MTNLIYIFKLLFVVLKVIFRRLFGKKKMPNWNLKTEIIWATTRLTLLSSNKYGLPWLKKLSGSYTPKPKLDHLIEYVEEDSESGKYLKITPKGKLSQNLIVYFHGGGYVTGSPRAGIEFTSRLAIASKSMVVVPFYPTAPENKYPAAHKFAKEIAEQLLNDFKGKDIFFAGDSAGAALALSTANHISTSNTTQINGCVLISPWTEPIAGGGTIESNSANDVGDRNFLLACYNTYLGNNTVQQDFPLTFDQSNLIKLPRALITIGTSEMLLDQASRLAETLKRLNTETTFITYSTMFHTFWSQVPAIKEADQLVKDISDWINNNSTI